MVIFIRAEDWGATIGELANSMLASSARYHEHGHEAIRIISKPQRGEGLPCVVEWHGPVNGHWEPICAKIVHEGIGFSVIGVYYDAI